MFSDSAPKVRVKVYGEFACWTRPENKVERVSYECMTPSAARNILDSICWRPEMRWVVTRISVLRPVVFQSFRRNEVQSKISPGDLKRWMQHPAGFSPMMVGAGSKEATPRNTLALRDVAYVIEAYPHVFEPTEDNHSTKYLAMFNRRVEKGQCFQRPSLGCREFAAHFEPATDQDVPLKTVDVDIGMMLYDILFRPDGNRPIFFSAALRAGVLDTRPEVALPSELGREVLACSYRR